MTFELVSWIAKPASSKSLPSGSFRAKCWDGRLLALAMGLLMMLLLSWSLQCSQSPWNLFGVSEKKNEDSTSTFMEYLPRSFNSSAELVISITHIFLDRCTKGYGPPSLSLSKFISVISSLLSIPPFSPYLSQSFYRDTPLSHACSHSPQASFLCFLLSLSVSSCYKLTTTVFRETHNPCHDKPQFYFISMERIKVFKKTFIGKPR